MGLTHAGLAQAIRGFRAMQRQLKGFEIGESKKDIEFLRANLDDYYGLVNLKEFCSRGILQ